MDTPQREFLNSLIDAPSPSGYEQPVRRVYREYTEAFADSVRSDVHGNVIASRNPQGEPRLMFAGHCDELGLPGQLHHERRVHLLQYHRRPRRRSGTRPPRCSPHPQRSGPRRHRPAGDPPDAPRRAGQAGQDREHLDRHRGCRQGRGDQLGADRRPRLPTT